MINERERAELFKLVQDLKEHIRDTAEFISGDEEDHFLDITEAMESYIGIIEAEV